MRTSPSDKLLSAEDIISLKNFIFVIVAAITLSYSSYLVFEPEVVSALGKEDHFFENMTAIFFLGGSIWFLLSFIKYKNWFFLLLSMALIFACGEEISWGQRLIGFETPELIDEINVQGEFTFHNIETVSSEDFEEHRKVGFEKLLTINFQYKLFWLVYGVLLPISVRKIPLIASFIRKYRLPVPPLSLGVFFLVNWLTYRIIRSFILPTGQVKQYYDTSGEIMECIFAFIFMILAIYFYRQHEEVKREEVA